MKKYSIGYIDSYGDFIKVWEKGYTKKFESIEEAEKFVKELSSKNIMKNIRIYEGWKVVKEIS